MVPPVTAVVALLLVSLLHAVKTTTAAAWTTAFSKPATSLLLRRKMALHASPSPASPTAAHAADRDDDGQLVLPASLLSRIAPDVLPSQGAPLHPVMVYGSLLSGLNNYHVMVQHRAAFVAPGRTVQPYYLSGLQSLLYPYLSAFPLVAPDQPSGSVVGEIYAVTSKALRLLDDFEGDEYVRAEVAVEVLSPPPAAGDGSGGKEEGVGAGGAPTQLHVYMYLLSAPDKVAPERPDLGSAGGALEVVVGGCWRSHVAERQQQKQK
jgi:gamma-glutamylcyclotransferase (GGCT)/AIG2-like uncharacterized protein YtfP